MVTQFRPPRPQVLDPELVERVRHVLGMAKNEVRGIEDAPNGLGILVTDHVGCQMLIADNDGEWRFAGLWRKANGDYVGPALAALNKQAKIEPWQLSDLEYEAQRLDLTKTTGMPPAKWIGSDPIRAYAWWSGYAAKEQCSMQEATVRSSTAAECRRVILASGWLADDEAAQL